MLKRSVTLSQFGEGDLNFVSQSVGIECHGGFRQLTEPLCVGNADGHRRISLGGRLPHGLNVPALETFQPTQDSATPSAASLPAVRLASCRVWLSVPDEANDAALF
jgi:hypothetical protein